MTYCDSCGGLTSEPGLFKCRRKPHPKPDLAWKILASIEDDLRDRRGVRQVIESFDGDIRREIRNELLRRIRRLLKAKGGTA